MDLINGLEQVNINSVQLVTWSLAIIAGSVATIVSTSYLRPISKAFRHIYWIFIPGWISLGSSIYYGDKISRRFIASKLVQEQDLMKIATSMNQDYACQRLMLGFGLLLFALWLVAFLCWWIVGNWSVSEEKLGEK